MKTILVVFGFLLLSGGKISAQPVCGFDQSNRALQQRYPAYRLLMEQNEQKIGEEIKRRKSDQRFHRKTMGIFTIPIVVHVLHTGDPVGSIFNPSDDQILASIDYLNAVFDGSDPSLTPAGTDAAGDMGLRFVLAKRDPDCNPTTGIHRVDMSSNTEYVTNGASNKDIAIDMAMKSPVIWDRTKYYNIYVVNKINGKDGTSGQFVAGYAYFPTSSVVDGTVMLATQMKPGSKTLTHEIGHAFNLFHTFEGSLNRDICPDGDGDYVDDTDPVSLNANSSGVVNFTCRTGNNPCVSQPYSIRTESNFMSYTNCYTLFTPNQKDRVQASVLLPQRIGLTTSNGSIPTYSSPVCVPKINFEKQSAEVKRIATALNGCVKYNDYLFNLTIGGDPIQNATVSLSVNALSSATENIDFDFPLGKDIVFPAGSNSSRSFTLRVYDNGSTAETKQLQLSFSINSGGGAAQAGTAIPQMDIYIHPNDKSPVVPGTAAVATVGTPDYQIGSARLFDATLAKQKTQILYKTSELVAAGLTEGSTITGLRMSLNKRSTRAFQNLSVKMAQTSITNLVAQGTVTVAGPMVTVLSLASYTTTNGWNTFTLTQPFTWDGVSNIAIEFCFDNGATGTGAPDIVRGYSDGSEEDYGNMIEDGNANCGQNFSAVSYYQFGVKPVVILDYTQYGNPVEQVLAQSREEHLGPFGEVYFYDQLQPQKIIARIKNLSDWNYGCTSISVDRAGNGTVPFWNNLTTQALTQKTFLVTPQNNNPLGSYEISLYYTDAEKQGYESATGNSWANVKMIKTEIPVASVTPATPEADRVNVNTAVAHTGYGTDHVVKAIFSSGFSGFAIGVVDAVLPVSWLRFEATQKDGNVQLRWSTAAEVNNSYFDVQVSTDGVGFNTIGTLRSKGVANNTTDYEYEHLNPGAGKLFYRIKQVDRDGKSTFSKITVLFIPAVGYHRLTVYPIPAGNSITLHFGKLVTDAVIEVFSSDMKLVHATKLSGMHQSTAINTGKWVAGTYIIKVTEGKTQYVQKVVKL